MASLNSPDLPWRLYLPDLCAKAVNEKMHFGKEENEEEEF